MSASAPEMSLPQWRFVLRSYIEHNNQANLELHVWVHGIAWLALATALSQVPLSVPFEVPLLGANLGAAFVVVSILYWLLVDVLVTAAVAALTIVWALVVPVWGRSHGWVGVALPLLVFAASQITLRFAHVYHHEHGDFLKGDPPWRTALHDVHVMIWGPFHSWLEALLRAGWRPKLKARLDADERRALSTRQHVPWDNWARLAPCRALYVCTPGTIEELTAAVVEARGRGQRVRVVASGFSWSSVAAGDQTLIFCERLDRIEVDVSDPARPVVWVEAGVTNRQLNRELARFGLCMPWNVVLETVRLAGIASTGTHGAGRASSTVGDLVEIFEVLDFEGSMHVLSDETVGAEIMSAARLGLGLFGVIARIKLRVVPIYRVAQTDERVPVKAMLERLPELIHAHDSVELYWFPFNDDMWMRTVDRTDAPRTFHGHGFWFRMQNFLQNAWIIVAAQLVSRFAPGLTPALSRLSMYFLPFRTRILDLPESHHYHHWIELMPAGCMEVGFKADADNANVRRAWEATERKVREYASRGLYPLNLTLNMRFTGSSAALLTPAYGEGLTCYVEIMWMGRPKGWREFTSELCREWLKEAGALPHWSKEFEHVEGVVRIMRDNLGDRRDRFLDALARSGIDPERGFFNAVTRRVLIDESPPEMMRIGIIGAGVSGMTAAWTLAEDHRVTLFDKAPRLGGHIETIPIEIDGKTVHAELGPRFFFDSAYPYFLALLRVLAVPIRWHELVLSFTDVARDQTLVLPPRSIRHLGALLGSVRLTRHVLSLRRLIEEQPVVASGRNYAISFRDHLARGGYPPSFGPEFAFPFLAACWGAPLDLLPEFPAYSLLKGMPSGKSPGTYVVDGGMSSYLRALGDELRGVDVRLGVGVQRIERAEEYVVEDDSGERHRFDKLIVATSSSHAAHLLRDVPAVADMHATIDCFRHMPIEIALHGDPSFMPRDRRDWADNNLFFDREAAWMSDWQGVHADVPVFRTWLPKGSATPQLLYARRSFAHVLMTPENAVLQRRIAALQGAAGLWVTGMYTVDVDNHESALLSGLIPALALAPRAKNLVRLREAVTSDAPHSLDILPGLSNVAALAI